MPTTANQLLAQPHLQAGVQPLDAEPLRRRRAQHDRRQARPSPRRASGPARRGRPRRPAASGRPAATRMPPVMAARHEVRASHRRRRAASTADTDCTAPTRRSIAGASSGSTASSPKIDCPGDSVSRFVPRSSSCGQQVGPRRRARCRRRPPARRCRSRCRAPTAPPAADASAGRWRRWRTRRARAAGSGDRAALDGAHCAASCRRRQRRQRLLALVPHDLPVEQGHTPRHARRQLAVVRDHDDRRARAVQVAQQVHHRGAGAAVEVARRLVGQDQRRLADQRPRDRHPLALAARQLRRPVPQPVARGRRAPAPPRRAAAARATGTPAYSRPVATLSTAVRASSRWKRWNTKPMRRARRADSWRSRQPPRCRAPASAHAAGARPVEQAHELQQRRLARARRADDGEQLAVARPSARRRAGRRRSPGSGGPRRLSSSDAHRSASTTRVPSSTPVARDLHVAVGEGADLDAHQLVAAAVDDLEGVAAAGQSPAAPRPGPRARRARPRSRRAPSPAPGRRRRCRVRPRA